MYYTPYICHHGVKGQKWGVRRYRSTGVASAIARHYNNKVDKSFKEWNKNAAKKTDAIEAGKNKNLAEMEYRKNRNSSTRQAYRQASKTYKKSLKSNTTYRKGTIKQEVGSDLSRKYLSEAKKVRKQLDANPSDKSLQKEYNKLMSKHDLERAKARRAPKVAEARSRKKASIKRALTMTVKGVVGTAAAVAGARFISAVYKDKQYDFSAEDVKRAVKIGEKFLKYV